MIAHVISRNCRLYAREGGYKRAAEAWERAKAEAKPGDRLRWDHESLMRSDFSEYPHCGLVHVPAASAEVPEKWVLTVAQFEKATPRKRVRR